VDELVGESPTWGKDKTPSCNKTPFKVNYLRFTVNVVKKDELRYQQFQEELQNSSTFPGFQELQNTRSNNVAVESGDARYIHGI